MICAHNVMKIMNAINVLKDIFYMKINVYYVKKSALNVVMTLNLIDGNLIYIFLLFLF